MGFQRKYFPEFLWAVKSQESEENKRKSAFRLFQKTHSTMSYAYLFKYIIIGDTGECSIELNFSFVSSDFSSIFQLASVAKTFASSFSCRKQSAAVSKRRPRCDFIRDFSIPPQAARLTMNKCVLRTKICWAIFVINMLENLYPLNRALVDSSEKKKILCFDRGRERNFVFFSSPSPTNVEIWDCLARDSLWRG